MSKFFSKRTRRCNLLQSFLLGIFCIFAIFAIQIARIYFPYESFDPFDSFGIANETNGTNISNGTNKANRANRAEKQKEQKDIYKKKLQNAFPSEYALQRPLPYETKDPLFNLSCSSCILLDVATGSILYAKNENQLIPPASMTKLFVCAIIEEEIRTGKIHPSDIVDLPKECLVENMPSDASLMVLHAQDKPTVEQLLLGLCVASGNDAAIALAVFSQGSEQKFVQKMNDLSSMLGLKNTHFVEPSGYSKENVTTAKEFAKFCLWYIRHFETSLAKYHSQKSFSYNGYTMTNTNKLLGLFEGVDGLKTGYIEESGFNLALTASRQGRRFLSVTMGGKGETTSEGNISRIHDGTILMNFAFDNFLPFFDDTSEESYLIRTFGAKKKKVILHPAFDVSMSIPKGIEMKKRVYLNDKVLILKDIRAFTPLGKIEFFCDSGILETVPIVATNDILACCKIEQLLDRFIYKLQSML